MAKVVGKDDTKLKRITCEGCTSIIEYIPNEVQCRSDGDGDVTHWITCPCCNKDVFIPRDSR